MFLRSGSLVRFGFSVFSKDMLKSWKYNFTIIKLDDYCHARVLRAQYGAGGLGKHDKFVL